MHENTTKAKLAAGESVLGCFVPYAEPALAELTALLGFDFVIFDGEHGTLEPRDVENLTRAVEHRGATPKARVTTNQPHLILRFLDTGVHGLHVPWVNTPAEVEAAVQAVKYGPRGVRGLAGSRASDWGVTESIGDYTRRANRETMLVVHIETAQAVATAAEYAAIDGVDVIFIGPTDLSHSLGYPGELDHPDVVAAMEHVAEAVVSSDKALGIYAGDAALARQWLDRGARYIATGIVGFVTSGIRGYLDQLRS